MRATIVAPGRGGAGRSHEAKLRHLQRQVNLVSHILVLHYNVKTRIASVRHEEFYSPPPL